MKFLALFALLVASVQAQSKTLPEAMAELKAVLRLPEMGFEWDLFRLADADVYQLTRFRMTSQGVNWDNFILHELKPALRVHAIIETCTTLTELGGVVRFRQELRSFVDEPLIDSTIARLRVESSAFNDWQVAVEQNQAAVHDLRCSPPVQQVFTVMYSEGVDLDFVLNIFLRVLFGGAAAAAC